ncbi:o-succinylbenzoate synthase [Cyclobacteriaceae bacterium]|nr:o-succinylbenzoate synthase [Cyclobacteriaceae bacterium]
MDVQIAFQKLQFRFEAGTSRGVLHDKKSWIVKLIKNDKIGYGEIAPLKGLSPEGYEDFEETLNKEIQIFINNDFQLENINISSSTLFGLETALLSLQQQSPFQISKNTFFEKGATIKINGLVWMGSKDFMLQQIDEKINKGFQCIKMKIGAINTHDEIDILQSIRKRYSSEQLTLRVDANGAFTLSEAKSILTKLSKHNIHSIEQPIKQGQIEQMAQLCQLPSSTGIALDEELIGIKDTKEKRDLLAKIKPQYIILKPTLHGGIRGTKEWIKLAEELNINWWITSALESNIGLNAICQIASEYQITTYQGLGTGSLYHNNIPSPLSLDGERIYYDSKTEWNLSQLNFKSFNA